MTQAAFRGWIKVRMPEARKTVVDNRYDVVRPLGSGGMGEVFLARDRVLGRDVALKVLRTTVRRRQRVRRALQAGGPERGHPLPSEHRPGLRQGRDGGRGLLHRHGVRAWRHAEGEDRRARVRSGRAEAAAIGAQVAEALGAAHERGMVHRDIKPQNVLLTGRGDAKVADFGIARAGSSVTISKTGSVMGTAGYMSPEQALGKPATPKSDLYSLGVVLYEALTGELPYTADNPIAVSMKHVNEPLRPPREIDPTIPEGMNALVTKLMAKDPEDRYAARRRARRRPLEGEPWAPPLRRRAGRRGPPQRAPGGPSNPTSKIPTARAGAGAAPQGHSLALDRWWPRSCFSSARSASSRTSWDRTPRTAGSTFWGRTNNPPASPPPRRP